ncbi:MAG TPA: GGDEF domain-containing protein [Xanthobacteraceae bacterium]|nr:GGDEF domain-containing protein [Xanthobacteraceae bacterium]
MQLHIPTLALVAVFVTVILGALLLFAWRRDQSTDALAWWGAGYLVGGLSFGLLSARGEIANVFSIEIANALLLLGYSFLLAGTRAFSGRETPVTVFLVAPLIWLTAMQVPAIATDIDLRVIIISSLQFSFIALMGYELWRERAEPLLSRWPTIILLATHAVILIGRMIVVMATPIMSHEDLFRSPVFAVMAFGTVLYTIAFAFLLLSMTKERTEMRHRIAALIDPLTGLPNRRAFMIDAEATIAGRASRSEAFAVLLADLDRFKAINDVYGHAIGDRVLTVFAASLHRCLGANDLAGRIGGEEFAILLAEKDEAAALALAERIRVVFADAAAEIGGHAVAATVSIGVAASRIGGHDLGGLLGRADGALYQAKEAGRNRVAAFAGDGSADAPLIPAAA